ncbi:MAG: MFS transporter [archaeon]
MGKILKNKNDSKALKAFALSSLLNDLGSDSIKPFWPLFVTNVLGAPVSILGVLDGFGEAISYGIRWPAGWLSDKFKKRKIFIWFGYLMAGLSRIGYAFSSNVAILFPLKAMDRLGKIRDPPRDALLSDIVKKKEKGSAFGILNAADNIGAMLGPLFGLFVFSILSYTGLFLVAAIPSFISVALILFFVKEKKIKTKQNRRVKLDLIFKKFLISGIAFALSWISISFLILWANRAGFEVTLLPFLLFTCSGFSALGSYLFGKLSDGIGRKKTLGFNYLLFSISLFSIALFGNTHPILFSVLLFIIYGLCFGGVTSLHSAFITDIVTKERQAEALGMFSTLFGFSSFGASTIAGILWEVASPEIAFLVAGSFAFLGYLLLMLFVKK